MYSFKMFFFFFFFFTTETFLDVFLIIIIKFIVHPLHVSAKFISIHAGNGTPSDNRFINNRDDKR